MGQPKFRHTKPIRESPPKRLRAPGMHRVPSGDLLANAVEDLGSGGALCRRAENLRPIRDKVTRRPRRLFARWRLTPGQAGPVVEELDGVPLQAAERLHDEYGVTRWPR